MKRRIVAKSIFSLTSDQIEQALAKGFLRIVNSTARPYRKNTATIPEALLEKYEQGANSYPPKIKQDRAKNWKKGQARSKKSMKGHAPIRSQTGHDHDRNHQKY